MSHEYCKTCRIIIVKNHNHVIPIYTNSNFNFCRCFCFVLMFSGVPSGGLFAVHLIYLYIRPGKRAIFLQFTSLLKLSSSANGLTSFDNRQSGGCFELGEPGCFRAGFRLACTEQHASQSCKHFFVFFLNSFRR